MFNDVAFFSLLLALLCIIVKIELLSEFIRYLDVITQQSWLGWSFNFDGVITKKFRYSVTSQFTTSKVTILSDTWFHIYFLKTSNPRILKNSSKFTDFLQYCSLRTGVFYIRQLMFESYSKPILQKIRQTSNVPENMLCCLFFLLHILLLRLSVSNSSQYDSYSTLMILSSC